MFVSKIKQVFQELTCNAAQQKAVDASATNILDTNLGASRSLSRGVAGLVSTGAPFAAFFVAVAWMRSSLTRAAPRAATGADSSAGGTAAGGTASADAARGSNQGRHGPAQPQNPVESIRTHRKHHHLDRVTVP